MDTFDAVTSPVIPDALIASVARILAVDNGWVAEDWDATKIPGKYRQRYFETARAALEAAAPQLMAQSWEDGAKAGWKQSGEGWNAEYPDESTGECSVDVSKNPYRG